ncbi:DegT/DnrJ/EryC1/StrS family aminotransferase [Streptomyces sp. NPDC002588]|uniref:DegT/DnrJ/EryC1/StrS family aminotransferase n=1 Tax=Streptomyces sp. NPDC002588 TaxID=3154419 RepID=UPI00332A6447
MTRPTRALSLFGGTPVVDRLPPAEPPTIAHDDIPLIVEMVRRGEISYTGRVGQVAHLEDEFLRYFGTGYALAVNSGTSALHSAFFGIGLEPGDEVLAPTYTFLATVMPVFAVNAVPVLVDADAETGNLDPAQLERHMTDRTRAVVVTHLNGFPADMRAVVEVAEKHGLHVIEDCSQAHGAVSSGRKVGTFGAAGAFSLQAKKPVTAGEGGMLLTSEPRLYERAVMLGHCLDRAEEDVTSLEYRAFAGTGFGLNYRIHPLGAALARGSLRRLESVLAARRANCEFLDGLLKDLPGIRPPARPAHMDRVAYYSYQPLYLAEELGGLPVDVFVRAAVAEGVPLSRPKSLPLHREAVFQDPSWHSGTFGPFAGGGKGYRHYRDEDFPASARYLSRALRLPVYSTPARRELERFAEALAKVVDNVEALHDLVRREQHR